MRRLEMSEGNCSRSIAPSSHFDLECSVKEMLMNDSRIVCLRNDEMFVGDLKPIDGLRCPQSCSLNH